MENVLADRALLRLRRPARLLRLTGDERLVALVRSGDEGAFEALYDRHHGAILGFCRHMLGSREEAEDAVQHTFLAAYRDLSASDKPIDLRPWLFAIARNRCLSLLRARRAHVAIELAEPATDGLAATVERREDLRELLADLAGLPEDQRAALLLAELGALDHAGIAAVLGCPREKVKALVFQARTSLAASREARATPCEDIRVELATASGAELRRGPLRRHLRTCDGCRAFKAEVATQRRLLALTLPVMPSVALKASVVVGGRGGVAGSGGVLGTVASTGAGKVAVSIAAVGAIAGGGALTAVVEQRRPTPAPSLVGARHAAPARSISSIAPAPHGATVGRPVHRDASRTRRRALRPPSPPAGERAGTPGIVVSAASPLPAPAPASLPTQTPTDAVAPAPGTVPPGRSSDRQPSGAAPGRGQAPPGRTKVPRAHDTTPPGQGKAPHGRANAPGQSRTPAASGSHPGGGQPSQRAGSGGSGAGGPPASPGTPSPGQSAAPPGQSGAAPGQSGAPPGQSAAPPGQSGTTPGQSGTTPGKSGAAHGHAN